MVLICLDHLDPNLQLATRHRSGSRAWVSGLTVIPKQFGSNAAFLLRPGNIELCDDLGTKKRHVFGVQSDPVCMGTLSMESCTIC